MPSILPFDRITTTTITSFDIESIEVILFSSARIRVNLYNSNGDRFDVTYVLMSGSDYTAWGNDDQYILQFVANTLGFTIFVPEPVVPVDPVPIDPVPVDPVPVDPVPVDPEPVDPII